MTTEPTRNPIAPYYSIIKLLLLVAALVTFVLLALNETWGNINAFQQTGVGFSFLTLALIVP